MKFSKQRSLKPVNSSSAGQRHRHTADTWPLSLHASIKVHKFVLVNESLPKIGVKNANNCYKIFLWREYWMVGVAPDTATGWTAQSWGQQSAGEIMGARNSVHFVYLYSSICKKYSCGGLYHAANCRIVNYLQWMSFVGLFTGSII